MTHRIEEIKIQGANEHNLKNIDLSIKRNAITVITGVSGSGKSSLAFDTVLAESQRRFFYTLSQYSRQFLDLGSRPAVRLVSGLSPAISLQQNETQPSKRASVGTLTDLSELVGVLLANHSGKGCPKHGLATTTRSPKQVVKSILEESDGKTIAICAPIAQEKKGAFTKQLTAFANKGYVRVHIDGELVSLSPVPVLNKEEKHTIKLVIDLVKVKAASEQRLQRGVDTAIEESKGFGELFLASATSGLDLDSIKVFSTSGGCPTCGFTWPRLDPRYFSSNSLGKCESCNGLGAMDFEPIVKTKSSKAAKKSSESVEKSKSQEVEISLFPNICFDCTGTGLSSKYSGMELGGLNHQQIHQLSFDDLKGLLTSLQESHLRENPAFIRVVNEVIQKLKQLTDVGLGYLQMSRRIHTLSGGEAQRLRLASILSDSLHGVMYVLDEPSQGLHPKELESVWKTLVSLKDKGNTVIIVDHDEFFMKNADWIIDLGPGGGAQGGNIMAVFKPKDAKSFVKQSLTAKHLVSNNKKKINGVSSHKKEFINIVDAGLNNLKIPNVKFMLGGFNIVTGVSGAGKSSLILSTLYPNLKKFSQESLLYQRAFRKAEYNKTVKPKKIKPEWRYCKEIEGAVLVSHISIIDRKPIAKSSVSMPVTYLDLFTDIRKLYEKLPDTQIAGLDAKSFSLFGAGGRCEECKGRGEVTLSMRFLADARVRCSVCFGKRYNENVCMIKYNDLSISEILGLTLNQAFEHFKNHKKIVKRLEPAIKLGLGYLKMGQTSASLSGGEAQRLKLVPYLSKTWEPGSILIIDEPTQGLHFEDVDRLMKILKEMVETGITVIMIEHNPDVIVQADWVVDLGPESSSNGGKLLFEGYPSKLVKVSKSPTGSYLASLM